MHYWAGVMGTASEGLHLGFGMRIRNTYEGVGVGGCASTLDASHRTQLTHMHGHQGFWIKIYV